MAATTPAWSSGSVTTWEVSGAMLPTTMGDDDVLELCAVELGELLQAAAASATTPMAAASCSVRTCLLDKVSPLLDYLANPALSDECGGGRSSSCSSGAYRGRGSRIANSRVTRIAEVAAEYVGRQPGGLRSGPLDACQSNVPLTSRG